MAFYNSFKETGFTHERYRGFQLGLNIDSLMALTESKGLDDYKVVLGEILKAIGETVDKERRGERIQ